MLSAEERCTRVTSDLTESPILNMILKAIESSERSLRSESIAVPAALTKPQLTTASFVLIL